LPNTDIDRWLPLRPVDFHILLVLTDAPMHGYGMVKEIEARSGGRIRLEPGNLYRYLRRLVDGGLVAPDVRRLARDSDDERRRYYRITSLGKRVLGAEGARMRALATAVEARVPLPREPSR
jgi:DNA-binding PadR family transcriptional regulator